MSGRKKNTCSKLKHRVTLQQEIQTPDGQGGYIRQWDDVAVLWAEIVPLTGNYPSSRGGGLEVFDAGQLQALMTHKMLIRYRSGLHAGMRFAFGDRLFNIKYVANSQQQNETLELLVEEGAAV
jgi:SPP1 family predicted phage head-tail adaptor